MDEMAVFSSSPTLTMSPEVVAGFGQTRTSHTSTAIITVAQTLCMIIHQRR
jgi:hypothetical protein